MGKVTLDKEDDTTETIISQNDVINHFKDASNSGTVQINEPSEIAETLKELNNDDLDNVSKMSNIDMRSRLHWRELGAILAIDTLVSFSFIPKRCLTFTRQKKRLAVSLKGKGREEIVQIARGTIDDDIKRKTGFIDRIKGMFGGGSKEWKKKN